MLTGRRRDRRCGGTARDPRHRDRQSARPRGRDQGSLRRPWPAELPGLLRSHLPGRRAQPSHELARSRRARTRYVLPASDRRVVLDGFIRLFHAWLRARNGAGTGAGAGAGMTAVAQPAQGFPLESVAAPPLTSPTVAAYHDAALYTSRLAGYPSPLDWWLTLHAPDVPADAPAAALLIRGPDASGRATLKAWRRAPGVDPAAPLPSLIAQLRRRGCTRLQVSTIAGSAFGRVLRRAGFIPRDDTVPLLARALTPAGAACVAAVDAWEITDLECDR